MGLASSGLSWVEVVLGRAVVFEGGLIVIALDQHQVAVSCRFVEVVAPASRLGSRRSDHAFEEGLQIGALFGQGCESGDNGYGVGHE
jgi:hypothetical protein